MTKQTFFIVGPTAVGKSQIAADVASELGAEIVSADAFQVYRGLDLLSAKPDPATVAKVPHHLIGILPLSETMNAEKYRNLASRALSDIHSRGKTALVVGGSGLYIKALTHGLSRAPAADPDLRAQLNELSLVDLQERLLTLDPETRIDLKNRRRLVRAIEICLLSGSPASEQRREWDVVAASAPTARTQNLSSTQGVFVFRERDDLYQRINRRVEEMFESGLIEEVRGAGATSETAAKMIGLREIRALLDGKISTAQCLAMIQQATRRYAKRQLTWFRRQTNFQLLNLSVLSHVESVKRILQLAKTPGVTQGND